MELGITNLNRNSDVTGSDGAEPLESIEDIIARGAAAATVSVTESAPDPGGVTFSDKPKRGRKPKASPDEKAQAQVQAELDVFFTPEGIGAVFTGGLNAFYIACGAPPLMPVAEGMPPIDPYAEQQMLARAFASWAKARFPASASKYQPDLLLASVLAMSLLPRLQPIAKATVPFWRRIFGWLARPFRRKRAGDG